MLSWCLLTKILHWSSVGSLLRVRCWLGRDSSAANGFVCLRLCSCGNPAFQVVLSLFDILYLLTSAAIFGLPLLWPWWELRVFRRVAAPVFGLAHIGRVGSVYLTMSVTIERCVLIKRRVKIKLNSALG